MRGYTITDVGKVRTENQDCVRFIQNTLPSYSVMVLCDGMGGERSGSVASKLAVDEFTTKITEYLNEKKPGMSLNDSIKASAEYANTMVYEKSMSDPIYSGMGSTIVAAVVRGRQCAVVNVGDSRAYHISHGKINQITRDHSFVEEMVIRGTITREQARVHPKRNIITRALGGGPTVQCDVFVPSFRSGDILLLCSDGLSNTITDQEILSLIGKHKGLPDIANELLDLALERGAPDNVTVGLIQK